MNNDPLILSLNQLWPVDEWSSDHVVVAVSGGPDSVALLMTILELRKDPGRTTVAHFNHALRGEASDSDERFVRELATQRGVHLECGNARDFGESISPGDSQSEDALRKIRYLFFSQVAERVDARWVAIGHHADDSVETFLHHLIRGSGPNGLSGIQCRRRLHDRCQIVRPLLNVTRAQIESFLAMRQAIFCVDLSNASSRYTRNRIRNGLLPFLRSIALDGNLEKRLLQTSRLIAEEHQLIETLAKKWLQDYEEPTSALDASESYRWAISLAAIAGEPWPVVREALVLVWEKHHWPLKDMGADHWLRLRALIQESSQTTHRRRIQLPGGLMAVCQKGTFRIEQANRKVDR